MKTQFYLIILFFLFITSVGCISSEDHKENEYTKLSGTIEGINNDKVFLVYSLNDEIFIIDSVLAKKNTFEFTIKINEPLLAILKSQNNHITFPIFLEHSNINVQGSVITKIPQKITGSKTHDIYVDFLDALKVFENRKANILDQILIASQNSDKPALKQLDSIFNNIESECIQYTKNYINANFKSEITPFLVYKNFKSISDTLLFPDILDSLNLYHPKSIYTKSIKQTLQIASEYTTGKCLPNIQYKDTNNLDHKLVDYIKDKTLIVFWASWSEKSINTLKNLKHSGDLSTTKTICIGLENNFSDWKWAANNEVAEGDFKHLSQLQGRRDSVYKNSFVNKLPYFFVVNKKGEILAQSSEKKDVFDFLKQN